MHLKRCPKGHFYDADQNRVCPHCASGDRLDNEPTQQAAPKRASTERARHGSLEANASAAQKKQPRSPGGQAARKLPSAIGATLTRAGGSAASAIAPTVGWLVCTHGVHFGAGVPLQEGFNRVGGDADMAARIKGEPGSAQAGCAAVAFDPSQNRFYALPGDASEPCYVNGSALRTQRELNKNDRLCVGGAVWMLIPCCDSAFSWLDEEER